MPAMLRLKHILVILPLLISETTRADVFGDHYGIGVVHVVPYNFFSLDFWKNPSDNVAYDRITFSRDSTPFVLRCEFATSGNDSVPAWFQPEIFRMNPNPRRLDFCCLQKDGDWCNVVVNKKTGETKWVELGFDVNFLSWEDFFKTIPGIEIISPDNLAYESPDAGSHSFPLTPEGTYQVIKPEKISGNWMLVDVIQLDEKHKEISRKQGWILWHDSTSLLVDYLF